MKIALSILLFIGEDYLLPCLNKQLLGIECTGCGIQRAAVLLFHGEFIEAFRMYPAIYPLILLTGFLLLDNFMKIKYANKISIFLIITSVATILINYILKFF
ncbi:DUF2752 domain-containing protein [uncultured Eudoraea sp.]|uniref:DUF2752 domain-containing protein n=1 Tax=uncultured Eudoraea sp. TaxID=1035614 RepID=UPI00183C6280|nr:DUF2752 domain-containing protein [uncultured Eudoraea sp.]MBT8182724.1 DUF2752 domain-containing protein [Eudoraea sp.]MBT8294254.1 DUF2752 domain-containing protein [Eudoraea sp.]NNL00753.1 DUF2752 domain-containing protein [Eudoraea sp.]